MSMSAKRERALLNSDEIAVLRSTHHPDIYDLDRKELSDLQTRLRNMRDKARTLAHQKQREARGKSAPRGKSFPGGVEQPQRRKQLFAAALKRVKKELNRLNKLEARMHHVDAAHKALAQRRASNFIPAIPASRTSGAGMQPQESVRRRRVLSRGKVGSVLKQNKVAQAARDARPQ
ncbi:hypothetical protein HYPDE_38958 [Hyphomicrobium denitrificans 1NES1]|uniref:Uncharacterized protein n=1 Tax=Hyphomicrobium denitrificans 1NES1 TaxID=670307 RepID=N0BG98_9HYPH|nr:hypothetical protein [Hyphomicrobium denitrificans]AGK59461.1 hypothetical protein HYPDE_38958 [Hyphomicrobium denitrificans 1NES1]